MEVISDLQSGKAGEYLVCADLILQGYIAFPSEQGLPYDVVVDVGSRLLKVQVKTTRQPRTLTQRAEHMTGYLFHVRRVGKGGQRRYTDADVDLFALVALDARSIGYVPVNVAGTTMIFRVPVFTGMYRDDTAAERRAEIIRLRESGLSYNKIAAEIGVDKSYVQRVTTGKQTGVPKGRYLHDFTFAKALEQII